MEKGQAPKTGKKRFQGLRSLWSFCFMALATLSLVFFTWVAFGFKLGPLLVVLDGLITALGAEQRYIQYIKLKYERRTATAVEQFGSGIPSGVLDNLVQTGEDPN